MSDTPLRIIMLAAENDAIPGAKVGGIGDVVRDVPKALAQLGHQVHVVIPAYGKFHQYPQAEWFSRVSVRFRQLKESVDIYSWDSDTLDPGDNQPAVRYWLLEHELFSIGGAGQIYCNDPDWAPFESDASKFALFCQAFAQAVSQNTFGPLDVVHLHDWHAAFYAVLREYDPYYQSQKQIRCVFTLHNLALQGIRPFDGNASSLKAWYPWLGYDPGALMDPRWQTCINPLASAIRLCDKTHTVSPSYAQEIQQPNAVESKGFHGGEGLEEVLQHTAATGKLEGILNGCDYSAPVQQKASWGDLCSTLLSANQGWLLANPVVYTIDYLADRTLHLWCNRSAAPQAATSLSKSTPKHIVTSIGRLTEQKVSLLMQQVDNSSAIELLLQELDGKGVFILLGTGDPHYEQLFTAVAARYDNFLFLNHFDQNVAEMLYASGTLFVMPSSYEPCGISQMLAMKNGQPCLVHAVGGLKDTVADNHNGFHFSGDTLADQARNLVSRFAEILALAENSSADWQAIRQHAANQRFDWQTAAQAYEAQLYR